MPYTVSTLTRMTKEAKMSWPAWTLTPTERRTLERVLDALLPPSGAFLAPSETRIIDRFILQRVPPTGALHEPLPYPGVDSAGLRGILATLADADDMTLELQRLERAEPSSFRTLWRLAVYGYYSQPETITAIQRDLAPAYHGAPLPLGYAHAIAPWDASDPLQRPSHTRGAYVRTEDVRRVDLHHVSQSDGETP
jgi:hypothetical protein